MVDVSTDGEHWRGTLPRPLAAALGAWWAGYAVAVARAVGLAVAGPVPGHAVVARACPWWSCRCWRSCSPCGRWPLDDPDVLGPRLGLAWLPDAVRRAVRPGLAGRRGAAGRRPGRRPRDGRASPGARWPRSRRPSPPVASAASCSPWPRSPRCPTWRCGPCRSSPGRGSGSSRAARSPGPGRRAGCCRWCRCSPRCRSPATSRGSPRSSVLVVVAVGAFVARRALAEVARLSRLRTKLAVALVGLHRHRPHPRGARPRRRWLGRAVPALGRGRTRPAGCSSRCSSSSASGPSSSSCATPGGCAGEPTPLRPPR